MRSQQINHRYSFPPLPTMNIVQSKPLLPEQSRFSTESLDDQMVDICTKYIPSSLFVPKDKLEPFESPLTESNLKFHTTIVSTFFYHFRFQKILFSCVYVFMLGSPTLDIGMSIRTRVEPSYGFEIYDDEVIPFSFTTSGGISNQLLKLGSGKKVTEAKGLEKQIDISEYQRSMRKFE